MVQPPANTLGWVFGHLLFSSILSCPVLIPLPLSTPGWDLGTSMERSVLGTCPRASQGGAWQRLLECFGQAILWKPAYLVHSDAAAEMLLEDHLSTVG